jgi:hypothetical protein
VYGALSYSGLDLRLGINKLLNHSDAAVEGASLMPRLDEVLA